GHRDATQLEELARPRAVAAHLANEAAGRGELLDAVVRVVGHPDVVVDVDRHAVGPPELAGLAALGAPGRDPFAGRAELRDPVVRIVCHVHVAGRVGGGIARRRQLTSTGATDAAADGA